MEDRVPGIGIDGTEGCMNRLAGAICLKKPIALHKDPNDEFHMDKHQVVCIGHQFKHGVTFMTLMAQHFLNNMARANNCSFQTQGHFDSAFNWCNKNLALIALGMNSMGKIGRATHQA
jgi:hypothetical protein